ncbi:MAG: transcriptional repressor [Betaproteobacteria bacterium]|nr:transcriptional repressor [Betaproteobacteria bacterium]
MDSDHSARQSVSERLRRHGITPTHQRMVIAQVLFERMEHLSAEQILLLVNERHAEASKATVYNTLRLFREKNLVRELVIDPSKVVYDPNTAPHHHIYNVETGELADIPADSIHVAGLPALPPELETERVDVIVRTRARRSGAKSSGHSAE